nr:helix-turn-helix domain-containing protein [Burkholderia ambifaria]
MEVFWRLGYEGTPMTDLTAAMGIASPSLYAAFGSKEALFRQAVEHYRETEGREIRGGVEQAGSAHDAIENYYVTVQQGMLIQVRDGASHRDLEAVTQAALAAWPARGRE